MAREAERARPRAPPATHPGLRPADDAPRLRRHARLGVLRRARSRHPPAPLAGAEAQARADRGELRGDQRLEDRLFYLPSRPTTAQRGEELDALFEAVAELRCVGTARAVRWRRARTNGRRSSPARSSFTKGAIFCVGSIARSEASTEPAARSGSSSHARPAQSVVAFDRMQDLAITDERFALPDDFDVEASRRRVRAHDPPRSAPRAHRVRRACRGGIARAGPPHAAPRDRARRAGAALDERGRPRQARRWVLGYGPSARVIEPVELAETVQSALRAALDRYEP